MKNITKLALGLGCLAGTAAFVVNAVDNMLVDRKWVIPQELGDRISGADLSLLMQEKEANMNWLESYGYERHAIVSDDGHKLKGYLLKAKEPSDVYAFCCHGYRSAGRDEFCAIARYYIEKGFNVFLVDHVASGESEGKFVTFGHTEHKDGIKWLYYLKEAFGEDIQIILHGISMGAATVMLMSGNENLPDNVKMTVTDCGYTSAWDEFEYKLKDMGVPEQPLLDAVNKVNKLKAGFDFKDTSALESVKNACKPMLFIHGGADTFVPTYMVSLLFDACASERKDLLIVDGADHAQSYLVDTAAYRAKLDEFVDEFIKIEEKV